MSRTILAIILAVCITHTMSHVQPAFAQGNPPGTITVATAVTGTHAATGTLDHGGGARWGNLTFSAAVSLPG